MDPEMEDQLMTLSTYGLAVVIAVIVTLVNLGQWMGVAVIVAYAQILFVLTPIYTRRALLNG